jgi:hypothetical protein
MNLSGTRTTENPCGNVVWLLPSCGERDPRTIEIGRTLKSPSSRTTAALFCRRSSSRVGKRSEIAMGFTVLNVTAPVTVGWTVYETFR